MVAAYTPGSLKIEAGRREKNSKEEGERVSKKNCYFKSMQ